MSEEKSNKALVVIDMLADFVEEGGKLYCGPGARRIVPVIRSSIDEAHATGTPVFYICDRHNPDDSEFSMFPPHCVVGTRGAEIIEELSPGQGDRIVPKRRFSAFYGTDFDLSLRELGITHLVLAGVCTNICVLYTAADARMRNYEVTVIENGVASFDEGAHRAALNEMKNTLGASIITALPRQLA